MAGVHLVPGTVCGANTQGGLFLTPLTSSNAADALGCTTTGFFTQDLRLAPSLQASGKELSGVAWVSRFPDNGSLDNLDTGFQAKVSAFISAIEAAGGSVQIESTRRPEERAYLMHYAFLIANGKIKPDKVPARAGVDIEWDHGNADKSKRAAQSMANAYHIAFEPSLTSNHTRGTAIDMSISHIIGKTMKNKAGKDIKVKDKPTLNQVGASYGVHKLVKDPPHWSHNGH